MLQHGVANRGSHTTSGKTPTLTIEENNDDTTKEHIVCILSTSVPCGIVCVTAGKCNWRHSGWSARLVGFPQCYLTCRFLTNKIFYLIQVWVVFRMKKREAENYQLICVNVSTSEDARLTVYRSGDSTGV